MAFSIPIERARTKAEKKRVEEGTIMHRLESASADSNLWRIFLAASMVFGRNLYSLCLHRR